MLIDEIRVENIEKKKLEAAESQISQLNQKLKMTEEAYLSLKLQLEQM